jgi:hypothetical protein
VNPGADEVGITVDCGRGTSGEHTLTVKVKPLP